MNWRRAGGILAAAWALSGLAVTSAAQLAGQAVKGFRLPEYDAEGRLTQQIHGETAMFLPDGVIQLTGLMLELYRNGEVSARVTSPECAYDPNRKRAASQEHIRIVTPRAVLTGDGFAWNGENEQFQIFRNAKVVLDAQLDSTLVAPRPAPGEEAPEPAVNEDGHE
ncbi:MAG: hypothetical protein GX548_00680 [Lentisphaerae bacterium]|nr:hypothetical protein [Lentisphaerota bacterium]